MYGLSTIKLNNNLSLLNILMATLVLNTSLLWSERAEAMGIFDPILLLADAVSETDTDIDLTAEELLEMTKLEKDVFGIFPVKFLEKPLADLIGSWQVEAINVSGRGNLLSIYFSQEHELRNGGSMKFARDIAINATDTVMEGGWSWELVGVTFNDKEVETFNFSPAQGAWLTLVGSDEKVSFGIMPIMKFMMKHGAALSAYYQAYEQKAEGITLFTGLIETLKWFSTTAGDNKLELVNGSPWLDALARLAPEKFGGAINFRQMLGNVAVMAIDTNGMHVTHNASNVSNGNGFSYQTHGKHINFSSHWSILACKCSGFGLKGVSAGKFALGKLRWATINKANIAGGKMMLSGYRQRILVGGTKGVSETITLE